MATVIKLNDLSKTIDLLKETSGELSAKPKRFSKRKFEDFLLAKSIDEGRKSGYVSKARVLKSLTNY